MPRELSDELALLALYHTTTRSEIFRSLVTEYIEKNAPTLTMVQEISNRLLNNWIRKKKVGKAVTFTKYCNEITEELERKKISHVHIQMIINKIKGTYDANKTTKNK